MSSVMAVAICFAMMPLNGQAQDKEMKDEEMTKDQTIVQIASGNDDLSILVKAVKAADLAETLSGKGPFTVFAPTDSAFQALPKGKLDTLMKAGNKKKLQAVLMNHVVSGGVMSGNLEDGQMVETMQGSKAEFTMEKAAMINDAKITKADIEASNGVIHIINKVLVPSDKMKKDKMEEDNGY